MHYAYNIGASAYSQLQILKGNEIDEEVNNEENEVGDDKLLKNACKIFPKQQKVSYPSPQSKLSSVDMLLPFATSRHPLWL